MVGIKLTADALPRLPDSVATPRYRQVDLRPGIVHFGVGNFHRAHQAVYLDDLFNLGLDHDWAVIGAGVRPADGAMRETLRRQDWLTTVVEQDKGVASARVTAAMIDYLEPGDGQAIVARLADPAIRIVSLTITEGGYYIDAAGRFNAAHPEIVSDATDISAPKTVFGLILAGLMRRRDAGAPPFTVMSSDNIPGNGHVTQEVTAGLAGLVDAALEDWVRGEVAFPNSMVDRITPATSERERTVLAERFGIEDGWPVFCEPFRQWVMEDHFPLGRPALEKVGVTFVADVAPYELMKLRMLNGGHATIAYPATLLDITYVHEAMETPLIREFLLRLEREEIIPVVPPVPNIALEDYLALIARRFSNPTIGDTIARLCQDGANRQPKFILPSAADRLRAGASVTGLTLVSALWCRACTLVSESGRAIAPMDAGAERLKAAALAARDDPKAFLGLREVFGELAENEAFADAFARNLRAVWRNGVRDTLARYVAGAA